MPTTAPDDLYWNPMDLDSDESLQYPKQYIDPWDLENYAYIRKHLDSVDLSSDPSSLGEPQETSAFYYIPAKPIEMHIKEEIYYPESLVDVDRTEKIYDSQQSHYQKDVDYYYSTQKATKRNMHSMARSDRQKNGGNYAAIDELLIRNDIASSRRSESQLESSVYVGSLSTQAQYPTFTRSTSRRKLEENMYDLYEYDMTGADIYGNLEHNSMQIYEKNKTLRRYQSHKNEGPVAKMAKSRSHSFSVGDPEFDPYGIHEPLHQQIYNDDIYMRSEIYDSHGSGPIYDDIRSSNRRSKPRHFKLSNYGHLKIDYSFSWNNLNKYIYN